MADGYYLNRTEIASFIPDIRAQRRFDLMQKTVAGNDEALTANIGSTQALKDATFITLSSNEELPNERVFRWGPGLDLEVDDQFSTLLLTSDVPRSSGGYQVTFVGSGDSSIAIPLTGKMATTENEETLKNKTLAAPLLEGLGNYADDAAAAAGDVPVGGIYRDGSALKVRVS